MSEMKYLMLFEAFEANALSKMMAFLAKKTDSNSKERFRDKLKTLITQLDIPIDKIKDNDIKYLNRNQALKLRNEKESDSIYCLKFWFSMDEGYLGFTGTGNVTMDFNEYISGSRRRSSSDKNSPFTNRELDYIKNRLDIKTGSLEPVKNYENIRHGQLVIGIFSDDEDSLERLGVAKIWRDENQLYAIQDVTSGGSPDNEINGVSWRDWGYRSSWSLDSVYSPGSDHCKLHIYTPSDEPIHVVGDKKEVEEVEVKSPFDFNLPVNRHYRLTEWGDTTWSIDGYQPVEKADFAIVLMVDDIIKSVGTKVSNVRKSREESKEGATSLMSDDEIKRANIKRYLLALISKMGITLDTSNLQNLQKMVIKATCDEFAFISIYKERPDFDTLNQISRDIYNMMDVESESDKKYYLERATSYYQSLSSNSDDYKKNYAESLEVIKKSDNVQIKEFFDIAMKMGDKIKKYLLSQNIQSIEDLRMIIIKLRSIRTISRENEFNFSGFVKSILDEFHYKSDVEYYIREYTNRDISKELTRIKHLERYVDSLLR
jgi:ribosome maturation factor RimP